MELKHLTYPKKCFCQFENEKLKPWIDKRFHQNIPTIDLLDEAENDEEREIISAVALLDVDDRTMLQIMGNVDTPKHHLIHCRDNVKEIMHLEKTD